MDAVVREQERALDDDGNAGTGDPGPRVAGQHGPEDHLAHVRGGVDEQDAAQLHPLGFLSGIGVCVGERAHTTPLQAQAHDGDADVDRAPTRGLQTERPTPGVPPPDRRGQADNPTERAPPDGRPS